MKSLFLSILCLFTLSHIAKASGEIKQVPFTDVQVNDQFWKQRLDVMRNTTIRYAFQKCTDAGQLRNFEYAGKIVSGEAQVGDLKFQSGNPYDDAEVYKVLEGASYVLTTQRDSELEAYCDGVVDLICSAQEPDGYIQTNFTIHNPLHPWYNGEKWTSDWNLSHETFNVAELIEAAIAYYQATGKDKLLNCAKKAADNMLGVFNEDGIKMAPGHAVVEMALVRLYELTREERYLLGCKFFLDCRGIRKFDPTSGDQRVNGKYWQDHLPAVEQRTAEGHAVRAMYFYSGMADWVRYSGDQAYETAVTAIWDNIASKKFYITGGFGSRDNNEAFGEDYELPNASAYCETCASVAGSMFNLRMFRLHGEGKYIDMLERALYNTVLDGYGIAGKTFYYPNRLASTARGDARSEWFGTSCCPTNLCRLIPSVPGYIYATDDDALYWNLFVASTATATVGDTKFNLTVTGSYPYKGEMKLTFNNVESQSSNSKYLKVRIPGWAVNKPVESDLYTYTNPTTTPVVIKLNGEEVAYTVQDGYAVLQHDWKAGDEVSLSLPMDIHQVVSNENLKTNKGLCSYERGPIVYCAEGVDNGGKLDNLFIPEGATGASSTAPSSLTGLFKGGLQQLRMNGKVGTLNGTEVETADRVIRLVPYFTRAHRAASPMLVWIPTDESKIQQPIQFIDEVIICNSASEQAHNLQGQNMRTGSDLGWRDAPNGWISYDLKIDPKRPTDLVLKLWGSDGGNRRFDIYCDGTVFSYEELNSFAPNEYYYMRHPIPYDLTKDKEKVTIKMQAINAENTVGGLFGVYTALPEDLPEGAMTVDYMWTTKASSRSSHRYNSNGGSGTFRNRTWLDGSGTVGQRWTMKVNSTHRNYLMLLYWGDEGDVRNFDIMCDDVLVASESLCHNDPGRFMMRCYPIPEEGTSGKETVRIHLTSPTGTTTGGIFYAYMIAVVDDGTGIDDAVLLNDKWSNGKWSNGKCYDLSGCKIDSSLLTLHSSFKKGICIVNGKKIAY
ncbi:MAG: glycoside hydrolase family 127 protein [Bacteroidaceae bacterium]|nr:glycoside hydrolase family 127 protein [Bacteroidaceae bacterium]